MSFDLRVALDAAELRLRLAECELDRADDYYQVARLVREVRAAETEVSLAKARLSAEIADQAA